MADFEFYEQLSPNQVAIPFAPNPLNTVEDREFREFYDRSGVAAWADERRKYGEMIDPRLLYVNTDGSHTVAWIAHAGVISYRDESPKSYKVHHVVCDCAAEVAIEAHPREVQSCDYVQAVLDQRAYEVGNDHGIDDLLVSLSYFDETALDVRLSYLGEELVTRALANVLEIDRYHPEQWMANRISGLHDVERLAAIVRQGTGVIMPLLEQMEQVGVVKLDGDKVKLDPRVL